VFRILLLCGLLVTSVSSFVFATDSVKATLFDKPLHERHAPLPPDPLNPQAKATLSCYYYPRLMVKQVDLGEMGAAEITFTFIARNQQEPPCRQKDAEDEKVVDLNARACYFEGVKGDYVFFKSFDGTEGAWGFTVLDLSGSVIFDFAAVNIHSINLMLPIEDFDQRPWHTNPLTVRYQTAYLAPCSLRSDEVKCWNLIREATGLTDKTPPDCTAAYKDLEKRDPNQDPKEAAADPSVVRFEVEAVLDSRGVIRITPVSKAGACYPAD